MILAAVCLIVSYQYLIPKSQEAAVSLGPGAGKETHHSITDAFKQLPTGKAKFFPRVQYKFDAPSEFELSLRKTRQKEVKNTFVKCWQAYKKNAWLHDELMPVSGKAKDTFGGWAATLVDSLDTLYIMELKDEFKEAVDAVANINFSETNLEQINVFETTIRYLGGFLGAYDLSKDKKLLQKATEVADMLYKAFDTPNRMPITRWDFHKAKSGQRQEAPEAVLVAEIGSLSLEFTRLSQITGDPKWYDAVSRISDVLEEQQDKTKIPGLWPIIVNAKDKDFTKFPNFTLSAMADSAYEYLPKMEILMGGLEPRYQEMYKKAMKAAVKDIIFRPMVPDDAADILVAGKSSVDGTKALLDGELQHLSCYLGGNMAMAGRLFEIEEHVQIGKKLCNGCIYFYAQMPYGIMPEVSHVIPCKSTSKCHWNETLWKDEVIKAQKNQGGDPTQILVSGRVPEGFSSLEDRRYILRPEAIESVFYLYRMTGEQALQAAAWNMWTAVQRYTQTEIANAALVDVASKDTIPAKLDSMEVCKTTHSIFHFHGLSLQFCRVFGWQRH